MTQTFRIHTSVTSAVAIKAVGEVVVSQTWKQTANQERKERAIVLPIEALKAPEVPETFRALVEAALLSSAEAVLKAHVNEAPNSFEVLAETFSRPALTEAFLTRDAVWISKQELEVAFTASATWKRIASREEFRSNSTYQAAANSFKETILKLTGKNVSLEATRCDQILSKLEDADLETPAFAFICKRLEALKTRKSDEVDLSAL